MLVWFRITLATFLARITAVSLCLSKLCPKYYWFLFSGHGVCTKRHSPDIQTMAFSDAAVPGRPARSSYEPRHDRCGPSTLTTHKMSLRLAPSPRLQCCTHCLERFTIKCPFMRLVVDVRTQTKKSENSSSFHHRVHVT